MVTSAQVRQKISDVVGKRSRVEQEIGAAESRKAAKESEAADKEARAGRSSSPATASMYRRQAESARSAALKEGKKIATLAKKRADLSKQEAGYNKDLLAALKSEAATQKREADKERRAREEQDRARETQRRTDEAERQRERLRGEQQRQADHYTVHARIDETEKRLEAQIHALHEPKQESLRILYATATPEGELRVSQEIRRVKAAVSSALHRDRVDIEHAPDVTASDLLDYLTSFQPHVVHFSGHANRDVLVFDEGTPEGGQGREIPIEVFMRALSAPDRPPVLVVLNACEAAVNLDVLLAGVPLAIGMSAPIGDVDAITFATRFYRSVADGQSVEGALTTASADMEMNGLPDQDLPTLIAAPGVDAATVRLVLPPAEAADAPRR